MKAIPDSVTKLAVLDKTMEEGQLGGPLYMDIVAGTQTGGRKLDLITTGTYGLSGKDFRPVHIKAVYDNLNAEKPKLK